MTLSDIAFIFNRALTRSFSRRKLLLMFTVLVLCGLLAVFFRSLAVNAGAWISLSLTFLPFFLSAGILLSAGIFLIRVYHDELKGKELRYRDILGKSWEIIIGASYFSIPIILCYLLLWMTLGIFVLFRQMPVIGDLFGAMLAFAPFLLNLGSLILALLNVFLLFFVTPALALKGLRGMQISQALVKRLKQDIFTNLLLLFFALLPLLAVLGLLTVAAKLPGVVCYRCENALFIAIRWFFMMIPFAAILSPAFVFFFNFAAESHVQMRKLLKKSLA